MAINLDEHKFFEFQRKMNVVPYSIAVKAVEEAREEASTPILERAFKQLEDSLTQLNKTISENDQDSSRES